MAAAAVVDSGFEELLGTLLTRRTWIVTADVFLRIVVSLFVAGSVSFRGWKKGSLTIDGALCAFAVGLTICFASARMCVAMLVFFWTSSWLTKLGSAYKARLDDTHNDGRRSWIQVLCNGGVAAVACGLWVLLVLGRLHALQELAVWETEMQPRLGKLSQAAAAAVSPSFVAELELRGNQSRQLVEALHWSPEWVAAGGPGGAAPVQPAWMPLSTNTLDLLPLDLRRDFLGTVLHLWGLTALATAAGDTWASELGVLFPGRPCLLIPPRRVPRGTNGAISLAGTVASGVGGLAVGASFVATHRIWSDLVWNWDSRFATHGVEHVTLPPELVPSRKSLDTAAPTSSPSSSTPYHSSSSPTLTIAEAPLPWYAIGRNMRHGAGHYYWHLPDTLFKSLLTSQAGAPPAPTADLCELSAVAPHDHNNANTGDSPDTHETGAAQDSAQSAEEWILRRQRNQRCGPHASTDPQGSGSTTKSSNGQATASTSSTTAGLAGTTSGAAPPAQWHTVWVCGLAGLLGSFVDSILGALFQYTGVTRDGRIVNERRRARARAYRRTQRMGRKSSEETEEEAAVTQVAGLCTCLSNNAVNLASILITPVLMVTLILWMEAPFFD